jgi:hypothetical protein
MVAIVKIMAHSMAGNVFALNCLVRLMNSGPFSSLATRSLPAYRSDKEEHGHALRQRDQKRRAKTVEKMIANAGRPVDAKSQPRGIAKADERK